MRALNNSEVNLVAGGDPDPATLIANGYTQTGPNTWERANEYGGGTTVTTYDPSSGVWSTSASSGVDSGVDLTPNVDCSAPPSGPGAEYELARQAEECGTE